MIEYGVKYPGMAGILPSPSKEVAQGSVDRAKRFPVTAGAILMKREAEYGEWEKA